MPDDFHPLLGHFPVYMNYTDKRAPLYPRNLFFECRFQNLFHFLYHLFEYVEIHGMDLTAW